ncbi:flavin-containing monooxygenase 5-like [Hemiscyllium ocellatum]|uniref:flavin-containing monooxygenase 5-like n=1 Tax=Hemiscyllium ocellatum TaxID=170820 RepID=UPI0029664249|nr:flavin-containing monooxygenase 5-like [Hemiscyllium ocellatum]XP_060686139.1 flavin-containing monooxygenase 5-like [Hemiscyllium ocellatum]
MTKRVAIIGGGSSGLACIKCCLDEDLEPVCFERGNDIGGLWNFQENVTDGRASIYKSLIINTSKEMMCFSDFPIPDDYPNYMHNSRILEYFHLYAKHFNLLKYIRFKTLVCSIRKRDDFSSTGQWDIVTRDAEDNLESTIFDGIMVCTGHHVNAHLPLDSFPGIEKFTGQYMHSKDYKGPIIFEGKKVVVIGIGNSGGDLAVEISRHAKQVFLSTRRGAWVLNRVANKGFPGDMLFNSRIITCIPKSVSSWIGERSVNNRFNHANYGLQPSHRIFSQHPTVNDDLPNRIIAGAVLVKSNVKRFTETAAIFEDGTMEDIDAVIFATGYNISFPFLDESVVNINKNHVSLYKYVFPPQLEQPTLAIIGLVQPLGAIMPISELQARWVTRVFKGLAKLPSVDIMMADITEKKKKMAERYVNSQRHTIQVDYIPYMDELAMQIGVKPNLKELFFTDPQLAFKVLFGPCSPYQFRLTGPGKWAKARETILTQWERTIKPTKTRAPAMNQQETSLPMLLKVMALLVAICALCLLL